MQIYFHSRLWSYLPRVPILVEGTVIYIYIYICLHIHHVYTSIVPLCAIHVHAVCYRCFFVHFISQSCKDDRSCVTRGKYMWQNMRAVDFRSK